MTINIYQKDFIDHFLKGRKLSEIMKTIKRAFPNNLQAVNISVDVLLDLKNGILTVDQDWLKFRKGGVK